MTAEEEQWVHPHHASFQAWLARRFQYLLESGDRDAAEIDGCIKLQPHQVLVRELLGATDSPLRGLLLFHGLGLGKTCASIAVAESFALSRGRRVFVLLPASLEPNYIQEIRKCSRGMCVHGLHWHYETPQEGATGPVGWVGDSSKEPNYPSLAAEEKEQVLATVERRIREQYTFLHFGLHLSKLKQLTDDGTRNAFDGSVIVVDEAHNLISATSNERLISRLVYDLIMTATDCRVVLLTGTPVINSAVEVAYLVNILKGPVTKHCYTDTPEHLVQAVSDSPVMEEVHMSSHRELCVTLLPSGLQYADRASGRLTQRTDTESARAQELLVQLDRLSSSHKVLTREHLPSDPQVFDEKYVDPDDGSLRTEQLPALAAKLQGCISVQESNTAAFQGLFPRVSEVLVIEVPMSALQFKKYMEVRAQEIMLEKKQVWRPQSRSGGPAAASPQQQERSDGAFVRPFSRALCNFAFPDGLERKYESTLEPGEEYEPYKDQLLAQLAGDHPDALRLSGGLRDCSPKFARLLENVEASPAGPVIVYSQFRTVEGIALLAKTFEANGYTALQVPRTPEEAAATLSATDKRYCLFDSAQPEATLQRLALFNGDFTGELEASLARQFPNKNRDGRVCKVLFLTKSGAEGISLKAVRQVHILEPYWHNVRVRQLIGRASRLNSHTDLPEAQRVVEVFVYVSSATPQQFADLFPLGVKHDNNLTSDQYILNVAQRKDQTMRQLLQLMRAVSVDCALMAPQTQDANGCLEKLLEMRQWKGELVRLDNTVYVLRRRGVAVVEEEDSTATATAASGGARLLGTLYDYDAYRHGKLQVVGTLVRGEDGKHTIQPAGGS
jgi:hypothetical protein